MHFRASPRDHGKTAEINSGRHHEAVCPENGPLVQNVSNGEAYIRPERSPTCCFSDEPEKAIVGMLSNGNAFEETAYIYKTTDTPDINLCNTPGVLEDVVPVNALCESIEELHFDFDLLGEVRYENPSENPIRVQKVGVVEIPPQIRCAVERVYGKDGLNRAALNNVINRVKNKINL